MENYWYRKTVLFMIEFVYSSLPNRRDVTAINFLRISTHNSVISTTMFIKNGPNFAPPCLFQAPRLLKSRNQVVQLPTTSLFQPPHHSKLENVFGFHIKVWKENLNASLCTRKNKSIECGIVVNCHLLPYVYTTEYRCAFSSI